MVNTMQPETKFLRLRTPVTIGSRFDDWTVTWLGGWTRDRLSYVVMVLKIERPPAGSKSDHTTNAMRSPK
jgi:hypothetical protein